MSLVYVGAEGFFPTPYFLQDPEKLSSSFASLHIRKVLYGIVFHDRREENASSDIYVQGGLNTKTHEKSFLKGFSATFYFLVQYERS